MADRDPLDLQEQVEALQCVGPAPLSQRAFRDALAQVRDLSPSSAKSVASKTCRGLRSLPVGDWRGVFLRLNPEQQLALARGLLDGGALELRVDDHAGDDLEPYQASAQLRALTNDFVEVGHAYDADLLDALIDRLLDIRERTVS